MENQQNKSPKFKIHFKKSNILDVNHLEKEYEKNRSSKEEFDYNPFRVQKLQKYNSIYSLFDFPGVNDQDQNKIGLNHKYDIVDLETIQDVDEVHEKSPVFVKFSPLLDPIRYMVGKYDVKNENLRTLPVWNNENLCHPKIFCQHNASFVDCFFSYLSSMLLNHHSIVHAVDFYGSYLAIQSKFKVDISDDLEYLYHSPFFNKNLNELFSITKTLENPFLQFGSRRNRNRLKISDSVSLVSVFSIENITDENENEKETSSLDEEKEIEYIKENFENENPEIHNPDSQSVISSSNSSDSSSSSNNSALNYTSDEDEEDDEDEDEDEEEDDDEEEDKDDEDEDKYVESNIPTDGESEEEEEEEIFCYINEFPIQMICLEKCDGTMDNLFENAEFDDKTAASALFQIIMTLLIYQKAFHFTHNDLHTNNIMYKNTSLKFLYYCYNGLYYKVPTYGKIFKIIDFGRGIYTFNNKVFCSDSFSATGDATTQYNFPPFFNNKKPEILPNYSFDLSRLGCSIYDFIIDDESQYNHLNDFQKTIYRWCSDDNGKNILYMKNGEERYPNFKLYKMIARTVHDHTPEKQLDYPFFSQFKIPPKTVKKIKELNTEIMNIDKIPCYVV